jgi:hypothetical protein
MLRPLDGSRSMRARASSMALVPSQGLVAPARHRAASTGPPPGARARRAGGHDGLLRERRGLIGSPELQAQPGESRERLGLSVGGRRPSGTARAVAARTGYPRRSAQGRARRDKPPGRAPAPGDRPERTRRRWSLAWSRAARASLQSAGLGAEGARQDQDAGAGDTGHRIREQSARRLQVLVGLGGIAGIPVSERQALECGGLQPFVRRVSRAESQTCWKRSRASGQRPWASRTLPSSPAVAARTAVEDVQSQRLRERTLRRSLMSPRLLAKRAAP